MFILLVILGGKLYQDGLTALFEAIINRRDSSHGIFVPFISAYLVWFRFDKIKELKPVPSPWHGSLLLLAGLILYYLANITSFSLALSILSFFFIIGAFILFLFGKKVFLETAFPLFFLATMIPLPPDVYIQIAEWMRQVNTSAAVLVTKAFGAPLYREEFTIYLPEVNLYVSDDCSGIRYLLSYFTFSLVYAFLFKQCLATRLLVVFGSFPLAVVAGITRLSIIFLAAYYINPALAEHRPHIILSWAVFVFWFVVAIGIGHFLPDGRVRENTKKTTDFC